MPEFLSTFDFSFARQLVERGGPVVVIILIMSIVGLAVALMKFVQFGALGVGRNRGIEAGLNKWLQGYPDQAVAVLSKLRGPTARVLVHTMHGVRHGMSENTVREDAQRVGQAALASLRSHLRVIEAVAQITPLLGLFGTVLGMMSAFQALQTAGADADPAALAGGIWVALITTAVGLAAAIPAGLALYWFEGRVEREAQNMEDALTSLFTGRLGLEQYHPPHTTNTAPRFPDAAE